MNRQLSQQTATDASTFMPAMPGRLQRKCACGTLTPGGGSCEGCATKKRGLQRKLHIGSVDDPLEREADRIADQVMSPSSLSYPSITIPAIQRFSNAEGDFGDEVPESVTRTLGAPGRPLETSLRERMDSRFGHDFSGVRVHNDGAAAQSAVDVQAKAYTVGNNIVFGPGEYAPDTSSGQRLIAHELTHVIQQSAASPSISSTLLRAPVEAGGNGRNRPGSTLPYREARDLLDCIRIMGPGSEDYCREEVLGEPPTGRAPGPRPAPAPPPVPCPLSIRGPAEVNHLCAAYVPSDAVTCGVFPAPNINLTVLGAAPGAPLTWSIVTGGTLASIVGPANAATVAIKGDAASVARNDVTVSVSNGTCAATHTLTVREPKDFVTVQTPTSGPSFVETIVDYTVVDQFGVAMGADVCVDETITVCSRSHAITPTFGDAGTNASGGVQDQLRAGVASGSLPASLCIRLNQSLTAGGCGPLRNNTITFRATGITLTPNSSCAVGDPCP